MKHPNVQLVVATLLPIATVGWVTQGPLKISRSYASLRLFSAPHTSDDSDNDSETTESAPKYDLGLGKNRPFVENRSNTTSQVNGGGSSPDFSFWNVPVPVAKPADYRPPSTHGSKQPSSTSDSSSSSNNLDNNKTIKTRRMVVRDNEARRLRGMIDEEHFATASTTTEASSPPVDEPQTATTTVMDNNDFLPITTANPIVVRPTAFYPDIDISIPDSVYCPEQNIDQVWDLLRWEAFQQAQQEPLLVSFLHSTILNHRSLESSLAFLLANRLQSPAMMISTQLQSLILEALQCRVFRRALRADMMAVRDRDPACAYLPDVYLYFKGFHALQSHRVAHVLWQQGRHVLALYLQSQVSQIFQIDIHPNATLGSGIMLDHGTGIVIGETASVGHNCSILHHVTLGGSGKKGLVRHPQVGDGVLLGAGATILGSVSIGDGSQVGAGTLVISDLPPHCVAVGVPARIIGSFVDVSQQPSTSMDQMMDDKNIIFTFESDGI